MARGGAPAPGRGLGRARLAWWLAGAPALAAIGHSLWGSVSHGGSFVAGPPAPPSRAPPAPGRGACSWQRRLRGGSGHRQGRRLVAMRSGAGVEVEELGRDLLVFLATTVAVVPLSKKAGITPILGFILAGLLIGPAGLKLVGNSEADVELGDFGILFLLFNEGLELSKERFTVLLQFVVSIGFPQILLSVFAIGFLVKFLPITMVGITPTDLTCLFIIGAAGALSSSAFVFPVLREKGWEERRLGVASCGVLLLQDLLVAPLLVVIPLLSRGEAAESVVLVLLKAALGFGAVVLAGSFVLQKIFEMVVDTRSMDTFVATALIVAVGMGALAEACGLSNATGAFAAGVLLAGTDYRAQIQADIRPFQGILLGIFFMTAGAGLDPQVVFQEWPTVLSLVAGLVVVKAAALGAIMPFTSLSVKDSARMSLLLAGGGEFAFVLLSLAKELDVLPDRLVNMLNAVVILSMSLTPFLGQAGDALGTWLEERSASGQEAGDAQPQPVEAAEAEPHKVDEEAEASGIVVCGFGDVGQGVSSVLSSQMPTANTLICFDLNPARIAEGALSGQPVVYGNGSCPRLLASAGVQRPEAIVMAYNSFNRRIQACRTLSAAYPGVPIVARARSPLEVDELMEAGATTVLSESEEVTVSLCKAVAKEFGKELNLTLARECIERVAADHPYNTASGSDQGTLGEPPIDVDLLAMDSGYSRAEVVRLYRVFQSADTDGNGEIDPVEARDMIARASASPLSGEDFRKYMRMLDTNGDGGVTFEEFLIVYASETEA